ncbi:MAG: hypothetical protein FWH40_04345 [Coriobacteriia bacterium]|nr:hypothetical protein [Coriobacteriia bacterium]
MVFNRKKRLMLVALTAAMVLTLLGSVPILAAADEPTAGGETEQAFYLTVRTPDDDTVFLLPTSSYLHGTTAGKPYDWAIDWGDGDIEAKSGTGSLDGGIPHAYALAGDYTIAITPNGSTDAWLGAFGFYETREGSNSEANKGMLVGVPSLITPQMTRTPSQVEGSDPAPTCEWSYTFCTCRFLTEAPSFAGWEDVTVVGDRFANNMLTRCNRLSSLPEGFNLPQELIEVGDGFAAGMFGSCPSLVAMPEGFNFPQGLTIVGHSFAHAMFSYCTDLAYLPDGFNLPQGLTSVGSSFAGTLFLNCSSLTGLPEGFNLPQGITSAGGGFASDLLWGAGCPTFQLNDEFRFPANISTDGTRSLNGTLHLSSSAPVQNRTAASVIGDCPTPSSQSYTFNDRFSDIDYIPVYWGGGGLTPPDDEDPEQAFYLTVRTPDDDTVFLLPTSSYLHGTTAGKPYDWAIDWGDGVVEARSGTGSLDGGIPHAYALAGDYTIAITPNGSTDAWLGAFGFYQTREGSNSEANKGMLIGVPSLITPQMTRTPSQIEGSEPAPTGEWSYTFCTCRFLTEAPSFAGWEDVTAVGDHFACDMFTRCNRLSSFPEGFNLPQGLTEAGDSFAARMFNSCPSLVAMPEGFNFPQGLTTVEGSFAFAMFGFCTDLVYLPDGFNLPQGPTSVGSYFADKLFVNCSSLAGLPAGFNLPQGITSAGGGFAIDMLWGAGGPTFQLNDEFRFPANISTKGTYSLSGTLYLSSSAPVQNRTAASIIGDCPTPDTLSNTFNDRFSDIDYIAVNWGGKGMVQLIAGSGDLNGDGMVTMDEVIIILKVASGIGTLDPEMYAVIDMDFDHMITMTDVILALKKTV